MSGLHQLRTTYRMIRFGVPLVRLGPDDHHTIADIVEKKARARADHPFILFGDRRVTYAEHNATANQVAHWALDVGLSPGDVAALMMSNRPEYVATWSGLTKIGVTTALVNTNLRGQALTHALQSAGVSTVIVGTELTDALDTIDPEIRAGITAWHWADPDDPPHTFPAGAEDLHDALADRSEANPDPATRAEVCTGDPFVYIYTSGTTGLPKAAQASATCVSWPLGVVPRMGGDPAARAHRRRTTAPCPSTTRPQVALC